MADRSEINGRLVSFAGATAILSLLVLIPLQMSQIDQFITQDLAQLAPPKRPGNNIYFIHPLGGNYLADMIQADPLLRNQDLLLVSHGAVLDTQMIQRNWPDAVKVSSNRAADQWYLGTEDRRQAIPGANDERQFVIAHIPH
jgi:L-ascorbate metabolism protein UlaG (beta-lactamase superfamily)